MAINIRNVLELLQQKEHEVTSSTSTDDLITLFKAAKKGAGAVIRSYDSDGALPDATTTTERIAFSEAAGELRFNNNGQWDYIVSGTEIYVPPPPPPPVTAVQGTNYAYVGNGGEARTIDKYPFASEGSGTTLGLLSGPGSNGGSTMSDTAGYSAGGALIKDIRKQVFASDTSVSISGYITAVSGTDGRGGGESGQSSETHGYTSGGGLTNIIDKFPFASDGNATDVGDLIITLRDGADASSITHGYVSAGQPPSRNIIQKFSFTSDGNAADVGDLTQAKYVVTGQSSYTNGYVTSGWMPGGTTVIEKFPFASDANATNIGSITVVRYGAAGNSSDVSGYTATGYLPPGTGASNIIDKFPFASDGNATDVGDTASNNYYANGYQY